MNERTDRLVRHFASAGTAIIAAGTLVSAGLAAWPTLRSDLGSRPSGYSTGEIVDLPKSVYAGRPATVVVFATASCGACQNAKPAFLRIVQTVRNDAPNAVVVFASVGDESRNIDYQAEIGLAASPSLSISHGQTRLLGVPTTMLLDERGRILWLKVGIPGPADERKLLEHVGLQSKRPPAIEDP